MTSPISRYRHLKSILEVPLLNDRYWQKIPSMSADGFMLDLEDSAGPDSKSIVRNRFLELLKTPEFFGGRQVIVRINNISSPWGRADIDAIATIKHDIIVCYPKIETSEEMREVVRQAREGAASRGLFAMIETAKAITDVDRIAACDGVVGLHFGYSDYAADVGCKQFEETGDDLYAPALLYPRSKVAVAAAAYGLFSTGGSLIPEYRDLTKVETFVRSWINLGYTGCVALSPAHLDVINRVLRPGPAELAAAQLTCEVYEAALASGRAAAFQGNRIITRPDYHVARLVLTRGQAA